MAHDYITEAEKSYRNLLYDECRQLFAGNPIPSHDHRHHERVWMNASLLLERLYSAGMVTDNRLAVKAIIASFFHDTGLTVNRGADHGRESRTICSVFLKNNGFAPEESLEILDAVEMHDNKEYPDLNDPASLASVISVADDMEAFGEEGIERYNEIYSMRGIKPDEMPGLVIPNVSSRLNHLRATYHMFPDLVEEMQIRAEIVTSHFTQLLK
jgi:HD superfamily phosphodiesterase